MKREDTLNRIRSRFEENAEKYRDKTNGIFCEITRGENGKSRENRCAKIYYSSYAVEFKYSARGIMSVVNSILECIVYFGKTEDALGIPLPFVVDYFDLDVAYPLFIPLITNSKGMDQAFDCLGTTLSILHDKLRIAADSSEGKKIEQFYLQEFNRSYRVVTDDTELTPETVLMTEDEVFGTADMYYSILTARFTSAPYLNALKGDKKRAAKDMRKVKGAFGYEQRMIRLWESGAETSCTDLSEIRENVKHYNNSGVQSSGKEFVAILISWIALTLCIAPLFVGIYLLLVQIESRASVYLMGPMWNLPFSIVAAFMLSLPLSYYTRFGFYKLVYKRDHGRYRELDHITNGDTSDKIIRFFLIVILTAGLIMMILFVRFNINFLDEGFVDNSKFFSVKGEYYSYDDIEYLYYLPDRTNDFGDVLEFPSYVMVLNSGIEIDFYEFDEIKKYEKELLPFLKEKGIKVYDRPIQQ